MLRYALKRLLGAIPTLLLVIVLAFLMVHAAPGGPFDAERVLPPETREALEAAYNLDQPLHRQFLDYLSGDDDADDGKLKVFDTLFATNHKFYGFADLFLNVPAHTAGQGLQDMALKLAVRPLDDWRFSLDAHSFRLAKTGGFDSGHLGEEIDFVATWTYSPNLSIQGGAAYVIQDDTWASIGRLSKDMTWLYLMMDARF